MVQAQTEQTLNLPGSDAVPQAILREDPVTMREVVEVFAVPHARECRAVDDLCVTPRRILRGARRLRARQFVKFAQTVNAARQQGIGQCRRQISSFFLGRVAFLS